jgi:hypothetical protein
MKIGELLYTGNVVTPSSTTKKVIGKQDSEYLDYNQENFRQNDQNKENKKHTLINHQKFFLYTQNQDEIDNEEETFQTEEQLVSKIKEMLSTSETLDIYNGFEELYNTERIKFSSSDESLNNDTLDVNNIQNNDIVISKDQSLLGIVTTVIHEIKHYKDVNDKALNINQSTNSFDLEVRAFAKEYEYILQNNYINDKSFQSLPEKVKDIYTTAYDITHNNSTLYTKDHMMDLLQTIGYERNDLIENEIITNKEVELNRQLNSSNSINSLLFQSKFGN